MKEEKNKIPRNMIYWTSGLGAEHTKNLNNILCAFPVTEKSKKEKCIVLCNNPFTFPDNGILPKFIAMISNVRYSIFFPN